MSSNPVLIAIWAVLAVCFLALLVYRSHLDRYETEQLFLTDEPVENQVEQKRKIVNRISRLSPAYNAIASATAVITASVVCIYVWEKWQQIQ